MDIQLVQKILKEKTLQQVITYLTSQEYDCDITKMSPLELFNYMIDIPKLPYQDEYVQAKRIMEYNQSQGNLDELNCNICKNKGYILSFNNSGCEVLKECECMIKRKTIRKAINSGLGDLLNKRINNYNAVEDWQKKIKETAIQYLTTNTNDWFGLIGQSGSGKTHICSAIINEFINRGKKAYYLLWSEWVDELKQCSLDTEDYKNLYMKYRDVDILYIDDLFKGKITEADIKIAFKLINARYNNKNQITIISSELDLNDLINIDAAIAGRLKERCGTYFIDIAKKPERNYRFRSVTNV